MHKRLYVSLTAAIVVASASSGSATMVQRMSLDGVTRTAARIVHATVTQVHSGRDESRLPATWITLDVMHTLKGSASDHFTIKQYGTAEPLADGTVTRIAGLPRYQVGDEVVLFLHADSQRGFTSPVGLGQGCYRVTRSASRTLVRSDLRRRAHDLDEFLSTVRQLAVATQ